MRRSVSAAVSVAGSGASVMRRHGYGRCVFAHQAGPAIASTEGALCADLVTIGFLQVQFVGADTQHLGEPPLITGVLPRPSLARSLWTVVHPESERSFAQDLRLSRQLLQSASRAGATGRL